MKEIENKEIIATYFIDGERIMQELYEFLKRKRVKIEIDDGKNIVGWNDNRIVKIQISNFGKVNLILFYEKYSDELIQYDASIRNIGVLATLSGSISAINSKGRSGALTIGYGATKALQAEKNIVKHLIGPVLRRNLLNIDSIQEDIFIKNNCGSILREGFAKSFIRNDKGKYSVAKGYLRFGTQCAYFKTVPESNILALHIIPKGSIKEVKKKLIKVGLLNSWYTVEIITKDSSVYNYLPLDGRLKRWIKMYS